MSSGIALGRLQEERKAWRKDHPVEFYAKPQRNGNDGSTNMFQWQAGIPGKKGTDWEGGVYKVSMEFSEEYPSKPPKCTYRSGIIMWNATGVRACMHASCWVRVCSSSVLTSFHDLYNTTGRFVPPLFHPNVYPSGTICLSILNEEEGWRPAITIKQILMGIQDLLDDPNPDSPAQSAAIDLWKTDKARYKKRIQQEARANPP